MFVGQDDTVFTPSRTEKITSAKTEAEVHANQRKQHACTAKSSPPMPGEHGAPRTSQLSELRPPRHNAQQQCQHDHLKCATLQGCPNAKLLDIPEEWRILNDHADIAAGRCAAAALLIHLRVCGVR